MIAFGKFTRHDLRGGNRKARKTIGRKMKVRVYCGSTTPGKLNFIHA